MRFSLFNAQFTTRWYCCHFFLLFFFWRYSPHLGLGLPPWNSPFHFGFLDLRPSVGLLGRVISSSQGLYLYTNTEKRTPNIHALSEIQTHDPGFRATEDSTCLRPLGTVTGSLPFYYSRILNLNFSSLLISATFYDLLFVFLLIL
jgi:hypothetical protein